MNDTTQTLDHDPLAGGILFEQGELAGDDSLFFFAAFQLREARYSEVIAFMIDEFSTLGIFLAHQEVIL